MIIDIYKKAVASLGEKPAKLWGLSLLSVLLTVLACSLFTIPGLTIAIGWLIQVAMCMIFLKAYIGDDICIDQLFECFKSWETVKRVLGGIGWMTLWIFIWSLIPVVGPVFGIIRTYEYRLTPYILMKEPEVKIKDAIKVSKARTMGYKGKMFWADIIWVAAVCLLAAILFALSLINYIGWIFGIANFVLIAFVSLFGIVFSGLIKSAFYVEIHKGVEGSDFYQEKKESKTKVCLNCGFAMNSADAFCSNCGAKGGEKVSAETEATEDTVEDEKKKTDPEEKKPSVKKTSSKPDTKASESKESTVKKAPASKTSAAKKAPASKASSTKNTNASKVPAAKKTSDSNKFEKTEK